MQKQDAASGDLLSVRLWDSGVRLQPGGQPLYLAQIAREELVQRLRLFSYWQSHPLGIAETQAVMAAVGGLQRKTVGDSLLLLRQESATGIPGSIGLETGKDVQQELQPGDRILEFEQVLLLDGRQRQ